MEKEPHPQLSASLYRMGMIPWSANPSTMTTSKSWPSLDGPSKMGNCQVSWPVYNGLSHWRGCMRRLKMFWRRLKTSLSKLAISLMQLNAYKAWATFYTCRTSKLQPASIQHSLEGIIFLCCRAIYMFVWNCSYPLPHEFFGDHCINTSAYPKFPSGRSNLFLLWFLLRKGLI